MSSEGTYEYATAKWYSWKGGKCEVEELVMYKLGKDSFFNFDNSVVAISSLPHEIVFENGVKIPPGNPAFCEFVKASYVERDRDDDAFVRSVTEKKDDAPKKEKEVTFVRRAHHFEPHVLRNLDFFMSQFPKNLRVVILTSIIGAQAGRHHYGQSTLPMFVAPITTQETCRLPNDKKRCHSDKFLC